MKQILIQNQQNIQLIIVSWVKYHCIVNIYFTFLPKFNEISLKKLLLVKMMEKTATFYTENRFFFGFLVVCREKCTQTAIHLIGPKKGELDFQFVKFFSTWMDSWKIQSLISKFEMRQHRMIQVQTKRNYHLSAQLAKTSFLFPCPFLRKTSHLPFSYEN